jgi:hypothetical protein
LTRIDECDIFLESFSNIIQRKDRTNAGDGLLIYAKDSIRMVRKQELENSIDATLWVEINAKGQSFLVCNTYRAQWTSHSSIRSSRCVSVNNRISKSSAKSLRKSILFLKLRILRLQREIVLSNPFLYAILIGHNGLTQITGTD